MDERIDFSRLEQPAPPDDLWPGIAGELGRRGRRRFTQGAFAVAAMISVIVLASVLVDAPAPPSGASIPVAATAELTLTELRSASARLETRLSDQRQSVVDGADLESLLWLEAELAWLDEQIAEAPAERELWLQRIQLLQQLNRRYADDDWRHDLLLAGV